MADAGAYLRDLFNIEDRTVVVTGAAGFFGRYIAETFLHAGARVVLLGRSAALAGRCEAYAREFGDGRCVARLVDFYDTPALDAVCAEVATAYEPSVLVNNAFDFSTRTGFNTPAGRLESSTLDQWASAFQSGIYWAVRTTQIIGGSMRARKAGSIINISSMYGAVSPKPDLYEGTSFFNPPSYGVVKAGLLAFTRYVASFWGADGIRCNALLPGAFPNLESRSANAVADGDEFLDRLAGRTLLRRVGHPRDLRGALLLLASDAGGYITGQGLVIDGGWTVN